MFVEWEGQCCRTSTCGGCCVVLHGAAQIGPKEAHAWDMKRGCTAPTAAGVIHTDLEKGFIRAEV